MDDNYNRMDYSKYRFEQALENLEEAEILYKNEKYKAATNRAYYSIFHSMKSVIALDGIDFKKHSGVISYFGKEYINKGIISKELGKMINRAQFYREQSDYVDFYIISKSDCEEQIKTAKQLLKEIKSYLKNKGVLV